MELSYIIIGISVSALVAIGVMFIFFPAATLRWGTNVLIPFLFKRMIFIGRRLGMEERSFETYEPGPNVVKFARAGGVWYMVVGLLFLVLLLGPFG